MLAVAFARACPLRWVGCGLIVDWRSHWVGDGFRALSCSAIWGSERGRGNANRTFRDRSWIGTCYRASILLTAAMNDLVLTKLFGQ